MTGTERPQVLLRSYYHMPEGDGRNVIARAFGHKWEVYTRSNGRFLRIATLHKSRSTPADVTTEFQRQCQAVEDAGGTPLPTTF